jgi:hypothetical protein
METRKTHADFLTQKPNYLWKTHPMCASLDIDWDAICHLFSLTWRVTIRVGWNLIGDIQYWQMHFLQCVHINASLGALCVLSVSVCKRYAARYQVSRGRNRFIQKYSCMYAYGNRRWKRQPNITFLLTFPLEKDKFCCRCKSIYNTPCDVILWLELCVLDVNSWSCMIWLTN